MKIGVGIIGLGWMGKIHAGLAASMDACRLLAVCDRDETRLQAARETFGVEGYTDHRALLARKDIDAVYIVTPPTVRLPIIRDCVEAKKGILCEKPLAVSLEELAAIREVVEGGAVRFMMCFPERFTVSFQEAQAVVARGLVGGIDYLRANFRFSMKKHGELHGGWVFDRRSGGGLILESSVHLWDAVRWITGSEVVEVLGLARDSTTSDREFEDNFVAVGRIASGALVCVDMSGSLPKDTPTDKRFEILGSEGCIYVDEFRNFLTVNSEKGIEANPGDFVKGLTYPDVMWHSRIEGGVKRLQEEFIRCFLEDRSPSPAAVDGARATVIALAVVRSLFSKRMEQVRHEW